MVDGIICASICKPYGSPEHRHIQAKSIAFKHDFIFKEVEFDLEPLMFNEALPISRFAWKYTWDPALRLFLKE
jgi:hypothetical protein